MARYLGPKCKLSKRIGLDLSLKSEQRYIEEKCKINFLPGQHTELKNRLTTFGLQFKEKQKVRYIYNLLETQFRLYYNKAYKQKGPTGFNLLILLESRFDNVLYRLGFVSTRNEARQFITHKFVKINGNICTSPSKKIMIGSVIEFRKNRSVAIEKKIQQNIGLMKQKAPSKWLFLDINTLQGGMLRYPTRPELASYIKEQHITELYSR
ncbi:UNVERIFIED_CONTAM: hypothetical protein GTU68_026391 [Idotea baltica]|nr:hypothetical protein [Idotea baltica]